MRLIWLKLDLLIAIRGAILIFLCIIGKNFILGNLLCHFGHIVTALLECQRTSGAQSPFLWLYRALGYWSFLSKRAPNADLMPPFLVPYEKV
jgi:hypothetical protein